MIAGDVLYDWPLAGYLIFVVVPILILLWRLFNYRKKGLEHFLPFSSANSLVLPRSKIIFWAKVFALCLAWGLAATALMQPKGNPRYPKGVQIAAEKPITAKRKAHDVMFLIDASASMSTPDAANGETRLAFAKEIADEVASKLSGETASLYAFTSQTTKLVPSTMDYLYLRLILRDLAINEGETTGTSLANALTDMRKIYNARPPELLKTVILISDGGDTHLEELSGSAKENEIARIAGLGGNTERENLRVFTIGMGSKTPTAIPNILFHGKPVLSSIDEQVLQQISQQGRGHYYFANNYASPELATELISEINRNDPFTQEVIERGANLEQGDFIYDLYFQIYLGFSILLLAFVLCFPDTKKIPLVSLTASILALASPAWADEASNQQMREAATYMEMQYYDSAINIYDKLLATPLSSWEKDFLLYAIGTALLEKGEFDNAIAQFNVIPTDSGTSPLFLTRLYTNLAVAYLRQGQLVMKSGTTKQDDKDKAIFLFHMALENTEKALEAACELSKLEGFDTCQSVYDLKKMKSTAKIRLKELLGEDWSQRLSKEELIKIAKQRERRQSTTPKEILENGIEDQKHALSVNRNILQLSSSTGVTPVLAGSQIDTIETVALFLTSVLNFQIAAYQNGGCQCKPWDEVIPLFNQGYSAATEAAKILQETNPDQRAAMLKQELALKYWQEALELLNKGKQGPPPPQKENEKSQESEKAPSETTTKEDILRSLLEMYQEDRIPRAAPKQIQQAERPW